MREIGAIAIVSLLLAAATVAMWREILTFCIIIVLAIVFVGVFGVASETKKLLTRASTAPTHLVIHTAGLIGRDDAGREPDRGTVDYLRVQGGFNR